VARVHAVERIAQPAPSVTVQPGQGCREIDPVLLQVRVLGLEEEDDLGPAVGDPILGVFDQLLVPEPDRGIAPEWARRASTSEVLPD